MQDNKALNLSIKLLEACKQPHPNLETIKALIEKKAEVHTKDSLGMNSLHYACRSNANLTVIQYLVNAKLDPALTCGKGRDSLVWALGNVAGKTSLSVLSFLLESIGKDRINAPIDDEKTSYLQFACMSKILDLSAIKFLVEEKADVNQLDSCNQHSLLFICSSQQSAAKDIVEYLILQGADLTIKNNVNQTCLIRVCKQSPLNHELLSFLLKQQTVQEKLLNESPYKQLFITKILKNRDYPLALCLFSIFQDFSDIKVKLSASQKTFLHVLCYQLMQQEIHLSQVKKLIHKTIASQYFSSDFMQPLPQKDKDRLKSWFLAAKHVEKRLQSQTPLYKFPKPLKNRIAAQSCDVLNLALNVIINDEQGKKSQHILETVFSQLCNSLKKIHLTPL